MIDHLDSLPSHYSLASKRSSVKYDLVMVQDTHVLGARCDGARCDGEQIRDRCRTYLCGVVWV